MASSIRRFKDRAPQKIVYMANGQHLASITSFPSPTLNGKALLFDLTFFKTNVYVCIIIFLIANKTHLCTPVEGGRDERMKLLVDDSHLV